MSITLLLVLLTGLVSYQAFNNPAISQKLLLHPYSVYHHGEWYRLLTHGFVHADWGHLLINMFVLYQFGELMELYFQGIFGGAFGKGVYVLFYLAAIVLSGLPSYFKHKHNSYFGALGASGATSAVVFAFIFFYPWEWFLFPPLPALLFGVGYLWYSSYMSKHGQDNIGHDAHFWGAVYGFAFIVVSALAFRPEFFDAFLHNLLQGPSRPPFL